MKVQRRDFVKYSDKQLCSVRYLGKNTSKIQNASYKDVNIHNHFSIKKAAGSEPQSSKFTLLILLLCLTILLLWQQI